MMRTGHPPGHGNTGPHPNQDLIALNLRKA